jgi:uncharacterized NAD(P)/FAD-binding protein YdhS
LSVLADQPTHFVEWLQARPEYANHSPAALREEFVPRRIYGDYLHSLFHWSQVEAAPPKNIQIQSMIGEATRIVAAESQWRVLVSGNELLADKIVLAIGNLPAAPLRLPGLNADNPRYINNPWSAFEERLPNRFTDLLLVGTGLTMIDAFLVLRRLDWQGSISAVSPHGWLPSSHYEGIEYPNFADDKMIGMSLRQILAVLRRHYRLALAGGVNPAILVDKLRPFSQRIWQNFSIREKRQFLRHLQSRWNTTRHRVAPGVHRQLTEAIESGRLKVIKGLPSKCEETESGVSVSIQDGPTPRVITVGSIINCTRPRQDYIGPHSPLLSHLNSQGLIQPDDLNLGIKVSNNFSIHARNGHPSSSLYALGSILKGMLWETTAVPELRSQAFRIAEVIANQLGQAAC